MTFARALLQLALCAILFVATSFAASKKFDRHNRSSYRNDSSARNGDLTSAGRSASSHGMAASLSNGERSGSSLVLVSPGTPDQWKGGTGNWSAAGNWNHGVPGMSSDVKIYSNGSNGDDVVTLDVGSTTINSLKLGGVSNGFTSELTDAGVAQTLTITNALNVGQTGSLSLLGSTVTAGTNSSNAGHIQLGQGTTLSINSSLNNSGLIDLSQDGTLAVSSKLTNQGDVETNGGTIHVGSLNNGNLIYLHFCGTELVVDGDAKNSGGIGLNGGCGFVTLSIGGKLTNSGSINVGQAGGQALVFKGDVNNSGVISTEGSGGGSTLEIAGKLINNAGGSLVLYPSPGFTGDTATIGSVVNSSALGLNPGLIDLENGSSLTVNGNVNNTGNLYTSFYGGSGGNTLTITGTLNNHATGAGAGLLVLYGPGDTATIGNVVNLGGLGAGFIDLENGSSLTVKGNVANGIGQEDGEIYTGHFGGSGGNTLTINGTLNQGHNSTFQMLGPGDKATIGKVVADGGVFDLENGSTLTVDGNWVNNLSPITTGGSGGNTLTIKGKLTNDSGSLVMSGPGDKATVGSVVNSEFGSIDLENGSTLRATGGINNSGTLSLSGQGGSGGNTLRIPGQISLTNNATGVFAMYGPGDRARIGNLNNSGTVALENGSKLTALNDFSNNAGGSVLLSGPGTSAASPESLTNGGLIALNNGADLFARDITNTGTIATSGGSTLEIALGLTNNAGGSLTLNGPGDMATFGRVDNTGTIDVENASTLTINGDVNNLGNLYAGYFQGKGDNTLTITGTLNNSGLVGLFFSTLQVNGNVNNTTDLELVSSTLEINGNMDNSGWVRTDPSVPGDMIHVTGTLTNTGLFAVRSPGDTAMIGSVENNLGGTIDVESASALTVHGDVSNSGMICTNCVSGSGGSNTIAISGMLTNAATGQISLNGPGDVLQALAGLTNSGTILVNNGSSIDPPFVNNLGTINIGSMSRMVVGTGNPGGTGYIQLANGTLGEMISSTNFGVINVNGSALLDGTLAVLLQGGYNPAVGSMYKFLLANPGQISGTFASVLNEFFNGGTEKWLVNYDNADGFVELTAEANNVPEPATLLVLIPGLLGMAYGLRRRSVRGL